MASQSSDISTDAIQSILAAAAFLQNFQLAYNRLLALQAGINLYQAETDDVYNGAVEQVLNGTGIATIASLKTGLDSLISTWTASYDSLVLPG